MNMTKIILKKGREESLLRFHPWVFSGAIAQIVGEPAEGDIVGVFASDGSFLAYGHYQIGSIAVRVLSFNGENPTKPDFFRNMLSKALRLRIGEPIVIQNKPPTFILNKPPTVIRDLIQFLLRILFQDPLRTAIA